MKQYYRMVQEKILVQRDIICSLLKDPQIIGDYYEAIIRDAVRESISESFTVGRGVILSETGQSSRECDIIIYSASEYGPLFVSGDIIVVNPEAVRCVIQVKGTISNDSLMDAIKSLAYVDRLRTGIWKLIVGFKTNVLYETLARKCAESKSVNGIFILSTSSMREKEDITVQMQKFVGLLKSITAPGMYHKTDAGNYLALEATGTNKFAGVQFPD